MKKEHNLLWVIVMLLVVGLVIFIINNQKQEEEDLGNFAGVDSYNSTSTEPMTVGMNLLLKTGYQTSAVNLGTVTIASTSPATEGYVKLWSATSTSDSASSTLVRLPSDLAAGSYDFHIFMIRGLAIELPTGFEGDWVITYK